MIKRTLIFVHRWLGVALCLLFLLWFPSGIGMMYWDFPGISPADRLAHAPALDRSLIRLSPAEALAKLDVDSAPAQVRLNTFDGRPVYRFRFGRDDAIVYADTGEEQVDITRAMVDRAAFAWTQQPVELAEVHAVEKVDQWTVQTRLRDVAPLWKYSWPDGAQAYVSEATGQVVQYTTRGSRLGAYVGAIPHWFYFTPLRTNGPLWSRVVIWSSGIGTVAAILGVIIGAWMYSPSKRYRFDGKPTSIPYRGQKRLHTIFGLIFGIAAITWAFSGLLSMDPFPLPSGGGGAPAANVPQALRGRLQLAAFGSRSPQDALALLDAADVRELELTSFAGDPFYLATLGDGTTRIVPLTGVPQRQFEPRRIANVIAAATRASGGADIRMVEQYDAYYLDRRRRLPLPVVLAVLHDANHTRYYVAPATGRIVGGYSSENWITRWVYHGLHSFDFPWLYNYRPLWDIVVLTFMIGGTALCVTSLILAWQVLGRSLKGAGRGYATLQDSSSRTM